MREQYPFFREGDERTAAVIGEEAASSDLNGSYQKPYAVLTQNRLYCKNEQGNFIVALSGILSAGWAAVSKNAKLLWAALICIAALLVACVVPSGNALPEILSLRLLNAGNVAIKAYQLTPEPIDRTVPMPVAWDSISGYLGQYSAKELEEIYDRCGLELFPQNAETAQTLLDTVTEMSQGSEDNALMLELAQLILKYDPDWKRSNNNFFKGWVRFVENELDDTVVSFDEETKQAADDFCAAMEIICGEYYLEQYAIPFFLQEHGFERIDEEGFLPTPISGIVDTLNDGFARAFGDEDTVLSLYDYRYGDHFYERIDEYFEDYGYIFWDWPGAVITWSVYSYGGEEITGADVLRILELSARYGNPWEVAAQIGVAEDDTDNLLSELEPYYEEIARFSAEEQEELLLPLILNGKENIGGFYEYQEYYKQNQDYWKKQAEVEELLNSSPIPFYTQSLYNSLTSGALSPFALRLGLITTPLAIYVSLIGGLAALAFLCLKRPRPAALCACVVGLVGLLRGLASLGSASLFSLLILVLSLAVIALSLLFLVSGGKKSVFQIVTTSGVFDFKAEEYTAEEFSSFQKAVSSVKAGA